MIQAKKITCKMFKTIILASGVIMVIVLAILTPMKETSFVCCSKAIVEYVLVVSLFLYIATWVSDIRQFSFALLVSIPLQEADSESV